MGYRRERKVFKLVFSDPEMAGLEVRAHAVPIGRMLKLMGLSELRERDVTSEDTKQINELFEGFSDALVSWNLEDEDGSPVPATLVGIYTQDFDFVFSIIMAWMDAVAGVQSPLERKSSGIAQHPVESLQTEVLTASLAS